MIDLHKLVLQNPWIIYHNAMDNYRFAIGIYKSMATYGFHGLSTILLWYSIGIYKPTMTYRFRGKGPEFADVCHPVVCGLGCGLGWCVMFVETKKMKYKYSSGKREEKKETYHWPFVHEWHVTQKKSILSPSIHHWHAWH